MLWPRVAEGLGIGLLVPLKVFFGSRLETVTAGESL